MGDAAAPYLYDVFWHPQPRWSVRVWDWVWAKVPWMPRGATSWGPHREPYELARELMARIRPSASALLPLIQQPLGNPADRHYFSALFAAGTLGAGASDAVPALVRALDSTNRLVVGVALQSLVGLGPAARGALPALIQCLDGPQFPRALRALGNIGPEARSAIPRIEELWPLDGKTVLPTVAVAFCRIDPQHPALKALIAQAADRGDVSRTQVALSALGEIGPPAQAAVPVLLKALAEPALAFQAAQALYRIAPDNQDAVPLFEKYLAADDLNAAMYLAQWHPPQEAGIAALAKVVESHKSDVIRVWSMSILYDLGPRARSAIPALEAATRHSSPVVRDAARCTLSKVQPGCQRRAAPVKAE